MEPLAILNADPLDILFDNRNKSYGAYPLRKYYDRRLSIALASSISAGILLFCLLTMGRKPVQPFIPEPPDVFIREVTLPAQPKVKIPQVKLHQVRAAAVVFNTPLIVQDDKVIKPMQEVAELTNARIGNTDLAGPQESGITPAGPANSAGTETAAPVVKPSGPEVYRTADVMPQYPGGQEALQRFLSGNLRMPDGAEAGTKVSVLATFVIGADGKLRQVDMTRSGGQAYDAEVKRVLAKMPLWIPGRVGTRTVPVYFSVPVQFVVPEE